jgi:hypothetical protein
MAEIHRNRGQGPYIDLLEEWAEFADSVVARWSGLGKRMIDEPSGSGDRFGPYQDIWMTMASAAGDLAEMSYRCVQALDGLAGSSYGRRGPGGPGGPGYDDYDEDDDEPEPAPAPKPAPGKNGGTTTAKTATKNGGTTTAAKTERKSASSRKK